MINCNGVNLSNKYKQALKRRTHLNAKHLWEIMYREKRVLRRHSPYVCTSGGNDTVTVKIEIGFSDNSENLEEIKNFLTIK